MSLELTHIFNDRIKLSYNQQALFDYVFVSQEVPFESPRPYFYPLNSLAGDNLACYRPYDHLWHVGLSMTWTYLNEQNFWGGNTYIHGEGYKALDNVGQTQHVSWNDITCDNNHAHLDHNLVWVNSHGETWLKEQRSIHISTEQAMAGFWSLEIAMRFENVSGNAITIGSPLTKGRPLAGYGGLFWRGPRSFTHANLFSAEQEGEDIVTHPKEWVAFAGPHDGTGRHSTLIFIDSPQNLRYPTKWWGRNEQFACVSSSFVYDEEYQFEADASLELSYKLLLCNDLRDVQQVAALVQDFGF